jgi:hypothetical protein
MPPAALRRDYWKISLKRALRLVASFSTAS